MIPILSFIINYSVGNNTDTVSICNKYWERFIFGGDSIFKVTSYTVNFITTTNLYATFSNITTDVLNPQTKW